MSTTPRAVQIRLPLHKSPCRRARPIVIIELTGPASADHVVDQLECLGIQRPFVAYPRIGTSRSAA